MVGQLYNMFGQKVRREKKGGYEKGKEGIRRRRMRRGECMLFVQKGRGREKEGKQIFSLQILSTLENIVFLTKLVYIFLSNLSLSNPFPPFLLSKYDILHPFLSSFFFSIQTQYQDLDDFLMALVPRLDEGGGELGCGSS